jgi:hypothetical protein
MDMGPPHKHPLQLGWRYCLSEYTPRAISTPDLFVVDFVTGPFPFRRFFDTGKHTNL